MNGPEGFIAVKRKALGNWIVDLDNTAHARQFSPFTLRLTNN